MTFTHSFRICREQTSEIYLQKNLEESFRELWYILYRMQKDIVLMNEIK